MKGVFSWGGGEVGDFEGAEDVDRGVSDGAHRSRCQAGAAFAIYSKHCLGGELKEELLPCVLLDAARWIDRKTPGHAETVLNHFPEDSTLWSLWSRGGPRDLLLARLKLIEAVNTSGTSPTILSLLQAAVDHGRDAWPVLSASRHVSREPAVLEQLRKNWPILFRQLKADVSPSTWDDPILLMVGETLAYLLGGRKETLPREGPCR